ncbi:MAG: N-acetyltransferase [Candidatus Saccharibacteria bacterium]|nr:N-acetyltransferase [Candidatus Saccharibacteria bacterium]
MAEQQLNQGYIVERLQPQDVESMTALYTRVWLESVGSEVYGMDPAERDAWVERYNSEAALQAVREATVEDIDTAEKVWFVAKDNDGQVIGMARPWRADEEGLQRVGAVYVDKDHQGEGIADSLMDQIIAWSDAERPLYLWVAEENERAKRFYQKVGFAVVGDERKTVYGNIPHIKMSRKGDKQ